MSDRSPRPGWAHWERSWSAVRVPEGEADASFWRTTQEASRPAPVSPPEVPAPAVEAPPPSQPSLPALRSIFIRPLQPAPVAPPAVTLAPDPAQATKPAQAEVEPAPVQAELEPAPVQAQAAMEPVQTSAAMEPLQPGAAMEPVQTSAATEPNRTAPPAEAERPIAGLLHRLRGLIGR